MSSENQLDRPSKPSYEIVPYEEQHRDEVLRLRSEFWAIDSRWNAAHFRWQQEENPCFDHHMIHLAFFEGKMVGMRVLQAAEWQAGSPPHRFRAPMFVGTYIDPDHRLRGLFGQLTKSIEAHLAEMGIHWALNTSPAPATLVASIAEGGRSIGALDSFVRDPSIMGRQFHHRVRRNLARMAGRLWPAPRGVQISDEARAREMADLAREQTAEDGRIRRVRDEAFFRWRFRDPSSRYRFVYVEREGDLVGFAVLHRRAPPSKERAFNLVDWGVGRDFTWKELLVIVVDYAERIQQDLCTWAGTHPAGAGVGLEELGFKYHKKPGPLARSRPTVVVREIGSDDPSASWTVEGQRVDDVSGWDLRMTDSDIF